MPARFFRMMLAALICCLSSSSLHAQQKTLPDHVLVGYWQNFTNGLLAIRLADTPSSFDIIEVSFATPDPAGNGGFSFALGPDLASHLSGGYSTADFDADVKILHAKGKLVLLAVGGQHRSFALTDEAMMLHFEQSTLREMKAHGFDGIDIDLEGVITDANVHYLESALKKLRQDVGPSFILTLAPQPSDMSPKTPEKASYLKLVENLGPIVTMVNTQYYNSGTKRGRDGRIYTDGTIDFITAQADDVLQFVPASRVGIGFTANPATRGYLPPEQAAAAVRCLMHRVGCGSYVPQQAYPDLRGAMMWSISGDTQQGHQLSSALHSQLK